MRFFILLLILVMPWPAAISEAAIYRWRDKAGVMHFSDDPAAVPARNRKDALHEPSSNRGNLQVIDARSLATKSDMGQRLWEDKCARCHHLGQGEADEKVGLLGILINPDTHFPESKASIVKKLRFATDGRYSDMPKINISDEELEKIASYLLHAVK